MPESEDQTPEIDNQAYRIRVIIEDEEGAEVVNISDYVYSNDDDTVNVAYRALRALRDKTRIV